MTPSIGPHENPETNPKEPLDQALSEKDLQDLADPEKQAEYRKAFAEQMRQRSCPGCGDDGTLLL